MSQPSVGARRIGVGVGEYQLITHLLLISFSPFKKNKIKNKKVKLTKQNKKIPVGVLKGD